MGSAHLELEVLVAGGDAVVEVELDLLLEAGGREEAAEAEEKRETERARGTQDSAAERAASSNLRGKNAHHPNGKQVCCRPGTAVKLLWPAVNPALAGEKVVFRP